MSKEKTPLHVAMRKAYRKDRYLRHLLQPDLNQRLRDIIINGLVLTPEAKIGLGRPEDEATQLLMLRWTEVLEEMQLRHGPYPNGFTREILHSDPFPDFVGELARKGAKVLAAKQLDPASVLIKYGTREHMTALHTQGRLRMQPASYFAALHHNGAIRDDERNLGVSLVLSREDVVALVVNPQDVAPDSGDQRVELNFQAINDFWLYCVTTSLDPRLFVDFNAGACVIIKDRDAFSERLTRAAAAALPGAQQLTGYAMYVDPHRPTTARINVPLAKHFRYGYQKEFRFAWLPDLPTESLTHMDIELGPLDDITELITIV